MIVFNNNDLQNFERINGIIHAPSGDYTQIKNFGEEIIFSDNCKFGDKSTFLEKCIFGNNSTFGASCKFVNPCKFGDGCVLGDTCTIGEFSKFGENCKFGNLIFFPGSCIFGEKCIFENKHIAKTGHPLLTFGGFGSVSNVIYFFNCEDGIFIRFGWFSGYIEEFNNYIYKKYKKNIYEEYKMLLDLVKMKWYNK